jgi:hypothetical protein
MLLKKGWFLGAMFVLHMILEQVSRTSKAQKKTRRVPLVGRVEDDIVYFMKTEDLEVFFITTKIEAYALGPSSWNSG